MPSEGINPFFHALIGSHQIINKKNFNKVVWLFLNQEKIAGFGGFCQWFV